ncbi:MAG: potassium transporter Kup [Phycisphaerales bacterium]|nr:potassium transporter Kup [Phycisphaerales bacterium]
MSKAGIAGLAVGAVGVVFGDIGTSPLYAIKESIAHLQLHGEPIEEFVLGLMSLVLWLLVFVVNVKYIFSITRASNRGEGGIFALISLIPRGLARGVRRSTLFYLMLAVLGAGLLFGDGIITPSMSVLSAMEGLVVFNPALSVAVVPSTMIILVAIFFAQQWGTGRIGSFFGPIMIVWFVVIALLGLRGIAMDTTVLRAFNPMYAFALIWAHPVACFFLLSAVVLVVTGAEALYADMGHFGIRSIRLAWYLLVGPALTLNYFGQGALALSRLKVDGTLPKGFNPFFELVPDGLLIPMVLLSTCAAVIASQAMISGVFSMARQAIRLNLLPRLEIVHTSDEHEGQIYLPTINALMLVGCLVTVLLFPSSSSLASAYGIAVTAVMGVTTFLFCTVARRLWRWRLPWVLLMGGAFLSVDLLLFAANAIKVLSGGWFALAIALGAFIVMATWVQGSFHLGKRIAEDSQSIHDFLGALWDDLTPRVDGTAVFLTTNYSTPIALKHFVEHAHVVHRQIVLLTIISSSLPVVPPWRQVRVEWLPDGVWKITARCGFMESPNIPRFLERTRAPGFEFNPEQTTYFTRRTQVLPTGPAKMARWRKRLFAALSRNATDATRSFNLPPSRVVDFGSQVEL